MRVYEEYGSKSEKRKAQDSARPLKRGDITGKARGYILLFPEDGFTSTARDYTYGGIGNVHHTEPGDGPHSLASVDPSVEYLRDNCRIVGMEYLPPVWQLTFANKLQYFLDVNAIPDGDVPRYKRVISKLRRSANARGNRKAVAR